MKPILRDLQTGLYFQGGATWAQDPEDALVYQDIDSAMEAARSSMMEDLELNVLLFDDPRYTLRLALREFITRQGLPEKSPQTGRTAGKSFAQ